MLQKCDWQWKCHSLLFSSMTSFDLTAISHRDILAGRHLTTPGATTYPRRVLFTHRKGLLITLSLLANIYCFITFFFSSFVVLFSLFIPHSSFHLFDFERISFLLLYYYPYFPFHRQPNEAWRVCIVFYYCIYGKQKMFGKRVPSGIGKGEETPIINLLKNTTLVTRCMFRDVFFISFLG